MKNFINIHARSSIRFLSPRSFYFNKPSPKQPIKSPATNRFFSTLRASDNKETDILIERLSRAATSHAVAKQLKELPHSKLVDLMLIKDTVNGINAKALGYLVNNSHLIEGFKDHIRTYPTLRPPFGMQYDVIHVKAFEASLADAETASQTKYEM